MGGFVKHNTKQGGPNSERKKTHVLPSYVYPCYTYNAYMYIYKKT